MPTFTVGFRFTLNHGHREIRDHIYVIAESEYAAREQFEKDYPRCTVTYVTHTES